MTPSYRSIDYSLRPGKHAERRMLSDALRKLTPFGSVEHYRYVGMGSLWYSDFAHFHRSLGLDDMVSIEREAQHRARFEFNKPYASIDLRFASTTTELPRLDWQVRSIIWLDYDDRLTRSILADSRMVAARANSGTVFIISVQVEGPPVYEIQDGEGNESFQEVESIDDLRERFFRGSVPATASNSDLRGWAVAKLARSMISLTIEAELAARNAGRPRNQWFQFKQFVAFEYADGAKMTTLGGIFVDAGQNALFESCDLSRLSYYRSSNEAVRLTVPVLTPREMRFLESRLPVAEGQQLQHGVIPARDANAFASLYRYLPSFAALES
ncbi:MULTISPECIES: O-methyltransferase [unclassified Bosea (in: a-proteobacteria)]|uniref:O-methyltransferase n=1 Tax=unclassified Bosea (in: a-proteobacteria) TaxID=2653178 RepID=UPI000F7EAD78|nr:MULTISPECIES: O-methyltransferase [unclassified Bosea (in: a-proteobacteria)]